MEEKKVIYVRVNKETHKRFAKYAIEHESNMNTIIEDIIQVVLDCNISPSEAIAAIRERAQKKPGE
jgi:DNA-directed RNA polymerase subunit L